MPRAKLRTPALRAQVLDVAVATLGREGVAGFTTRAVAAGAGTSTGAVYELFGDRAGLLREVFFEGFRRLGHRLAAVDTTGDARADLLAVLEVCRAFALDEGALADLMFSRPFADFDPGPDELAAGASAREPILDRVRRARAAGVVAGDESDIGHVLLAVVQGLAAQEAAGWLGTSPASVERRWDLALRAALDGLAPR